MSPREAREQEAHREGAAHAPARKGTTLETVACRGVSIDLKIAPGLAGLYQINVQVPTGLGAGDNVYVELVTDFADVNQIQIPYGTSSGAATVHASEQSSVRSALKAHRRPSRQK